MGPQGPDPAALQGLGRDESRAAVGNHPGRECPLAAGGEGAACRRGRRAVCQADGRCGGSPPRVHPGQRALRRGGRLMAFRFQKRISILPGVRINLSKSGVSASLGPRGADVNIGKDGVTANAGIPGTGLSYRQKIGKGGKGAWLAVLLVIGGLAVWAFQHQSKITKAIAPSRPPVSSTTPSTGSSTEASTDGPSTSPAPIHAADNMQRFVHRQGAILRDEPRTSG